MAQGKTEGGKWHCKPMQSKANLAMSCLALPRESLLSIERITRLISSIDRRREGKAWAGARQGQGHGNPRQRKASPPLYREERETPSLHKGESVSLLHREDADSFYIHNRQFANVPPTAGIKQKNGGEDHSTCNPSLVFVCRLQILRKNNEFGGGAPSVPLSFYLNN